jgi:uncharacterized membrane protein
MNENYENKFMRYIEQGNVKEEIRHKWEVLTSFVIIVNWISQIKENEEKVNWIL